MKIAFIGTHGTGKTTLSHSLTAELKKRGINAAMINETARKCPLPINEKGSFATQMWIMSAQICEELETIEKYSHLVCDRSVFDTYIYALVTGCSNDLIEKLADDWVKTYDYLFKVPILHPLSPDGIRSTDEKFQKDVDVMMDRVLKDKNIKHFRLPRENQIEFVKKVIEK